MPADGWQVELDTLPADVCQRIAGGEAGRWTHVLVDGHEISDAADATTACAGGTHMLVAQSYGGRRPGYAKQPIFHYADAQCVDARAKGIVNTTYCPTQA
jgi:hypothetical protein